MSKRASELASSATVAIAVALALGVWSFLAATPAYADYTGPATPAVGSSMIMFAVAFAILVEYMVMQQVLIEHRALSAVLVANIVSGVGCFLLYPIIVSIAEIFPQPSFTAHYASTAAFGLDYELLKAAALVPAAALMITALEMPVLVKRFALPPGGGSFKILWATNLASTLIVMLGAWLLLM